MHMYAVDTYYEANDNSSDEEAELADDATLPNSSRCKLNEKLIFCLITIIYVVVDPLSRCDDRSLPTEDISLPTNSNLASNDDDESDAVLKWQGFKIVGDNIDKNFRPSYQRMNSQTISLHFFHSFAVLDRVDLSGVSDTTNIGIVDVFKLLPSQEEVAITKQHFSVFISRYVAIA